MQLTKTQILEETVAYYSKNPAKRRAITRGICEYKTKAGQMCAVGRCMTPNVLKFTLGVGPFPVEEINAYLEMPINKALKTRYKNHPIDFWQDLQLLHDDEENWSGNGLSELGFTYAEILKQAYKN